jgi:hypothetical protein
MIHLEPQEVDTARYVHLVFKFLVVDWYIPGIYLCTFYAWYIPGSYLVYEGQYMVNPVYTGDVITNMAILECTRYIPGIYIQVLVR